MRGDDHQQNHIFSYLSPEARVRKDHPLRAIRTMVDEVLTQLSDGSTRCIPGLAGRRLRRRSQLRPQQSADAVLDPQRTLADGRDGLTTCCSAGSWG
jgi:hypothetical protein